MSVVLRTAPTAKTHLAGGQTFRPIKKKFLVNLLDIRKLTVSGVEEQMS